MRLAKGWPFCGAPITKEKPARKFKLALEFC